MVEEPKKPIKQDNSEKETNTNNVFIGTKPIMSYVTSTVMQLKQDSNEVTVRARGKFISKAVDVAEIVRKRFLKDLNLQIKNIQINTEEYNQNDKQIKVSTIDITISKN